MAEIARREFLGRTALGVGASVLSPGPAPAGAGVGPAAQPAPSAEAAPAIDFRYAPLAWQTSIAFPDDRFKSLVGERGDLRYAYGGWSVSQFSQWVRFGLAGMEPGTILSQALEAPGVPIVHTVLQVSTARLSMIAFASNRPAEGRVDNVVLEVLPSGTGTTSAAGVVGVSLDRECRGQNVGRIGCVRTVEPDALYLAADCNLGRFTSDGREVAFGLERRRLDPDLPARYFIRLPQEGQSLEQLREGLAAPDALLEETRRYWTNWRPVRGGVQMRYPGRLQEFLTASARNIMQAREERNGRLTFQVGATCYRGLWIVDGNFILESARYLGYDAEVQQGLVATWERQEKDGGLFAGGGREHWKDTAIALFTLVRQAELSQDWRTFDELRPQVLRAVGFLMALRDRARQGSSANGRYGLLAPGFCDGGVAGVRSEFTNTLWALAGLRAVVEAAARRRLEGFEGVRRFHAELSAACLAAARQEMRRHPDGFDYLPMVMKEDRDWEAEDDWARHKPQVAQWALSHAIYPGLLFDRDDPVVRGHVALMQAVTREDVPAETGWTHIGGLWTYNAAFVAEVYLWAGLRDWARRAFLGFLNHASPLYAWREEQPLRGALVSGYVGDMPHNWASAECIRYLRHLLALEDGSRLRLLEGIGQPELAAGEPYLLAGSPSRFGRIDLRLEPLPRGAGWRLAFERHDGPAPASIELPVLLEGVGRLSAVEGGGTRLEGGVVRVSPDTRRFAAAWKRS